jgi:hypothetical protein
MKAIGGVVPYPKNNLLPASPDFSGFSVIHDIVLKRAAEWDKADGCLQSDAGRSRDPRDLDWEVASLM